MGGIAKTNGVPRWLIRVLERAAAFDPERRYASAAAFSSALRGPRGAVKNWTADTALLLCGALTMGILLPRESGSRSGDVIAFGSACLESAVRAKLDQPVGDITCGDLTGVERLALMGETAFKREQSFSYRVACYLNNEYLRDAPAGDVSDLPLLSHMPNLTELHLDRHRTTDLSPLSELTLTTLALCDNQITDITPLQTMDSLETLYLGAIPSQATARWRH